MENLIRHESVMFSIADYRDKTLQKLARRVSATKFRIVSYTYTENDVKRAWKVLPEHTVVVSLWDGQGVFKDNITNTQYFRTSLNF